MAQISQLSNGVHIVTHRFPHRHSATLGVWLLNGARHETPEQSGYAHLLEHLLFKGTTTHSAEDLARCFDAMGGQVNAYTGRELTALHGLIPTAELYPLLGYFLDMLLKPRFDQDDLDLEKQVVLQEMAMIEENPEELLEERATAMAWSSHPMGRPILGDRGHIERAQAEKIHAYLRHILMGRRLWIVATGEVCHNTLIEACTSLNQLTVFPFPLQTAPQFQGGHHLQRGESEQSHLIWLLPTRGMDDHEYYTLLLTNQILGGSASSRLFQELRERRGLVYGIQSRLESYSDCGLWAIQTACDSDREDACRIAIEVTVETLIQTGPSHEELELARRHLSAELLLEEDDHEAYMERLARESIYLGYHPTLEQRLKNLAMVTKFDISKVLSNRWVNRLQLVNRP